MEAARSASLDTLLAAYRLAPEAKIFAPLADAYRRAGRLEDAAQVLEKGTALHPDYVSALVLLALVQRDLGRDAAAETTFDRVLALDPENLVALKSRATRALVQGEATRAEALVEKLYGLDPFDRDTQQLRDAVRAQRTAPLRPAAAMPRPESPPPAAPPTSEPARPAAAAPRSGQTPPWSAPPRQPAGTLGAAETAWSEPAPPTPAPVPPRSSERPAATDWTTPPAGSAPSPATAPPAAPGPGEWDVQRDADRIVIRPRPLSGEAPLQPPRAPGTDEFSTLTLARIYESQGYVDKAMAIYVELQRRQPGNAEIEARLQALRQRAATAPAPDPEADAAAPARWRLLDAETPAAAPEQAAAELRDLAATVRERERSKHHTQIGQPPEAPPLPTTVAPATEPDFERFLRYVRSLKRVR